MISSRTARDKGRLESGVIRCRSLAAYFPFEELHSCMKKSIAHRMRISTDGFFPRAIAHRIGYTLLVQTH
jgi:hypothetical protein